MHLQEMAVTMRMMNRVIFLLMLMTGIAQVASGQISHLSKKISVHIVNTGIDDALVQIAKAGNFSFSYDAKVINPTQKVSVTAKNSSVGDVLDDILGQEIRKKQVGNHVILIHPQEHEKRTVTPIPYSISGTIVDAETSRPLENVLVFEVNQRISELSNQEGRFSMVFQESRGRRCISVSKRGYRDTVMYLASSKDQSLDIRLTPESLLAIHRLEQRPVPVLLADMDSSNLLPAWLSEVDELKVVKWLVPKKSREAAKNLSIYGTRAFQASLVPYLGTNGRLSGTRSNAFSFNVFAGYARQLNGFELGGLVNIDRHAVRGFQLGGLANISGHYTTGFQLGGLVNFAMGPVTGFQLAGLLNYVPDTLKGVQIAGLCNVTGSRMKGLQIAGLCNLSSHDVNGWQIAGLFNYAKKEINKVQIGGLVNYGQGLSGFQLGGLINIARNSSHGVQVGGLCNYTDRLNGFQLGFINIIRKREKGTPVGFLSYIHKGGYFRAEVSADEVFYANIGLRLGTSRFYNIFKSGYGESSMMHFSWGAGTILPVSKRISFPVDLSVGVVTSTKNKMKYHGMLGKLSVTADILLAKRLTLFLGPTANLYWFNTGSTIKPNGIAPYTIYNRIPATGPHGLQFWVGGIAGIKI